MTTCARPRGSRRHGLTGTLLVSILVAPTCAGGTYKLDSLNEARAAVFEAHDELLNGAPSAPARLATARRHLSEVIAQQSAPKQGDDRWLQGLLLDACLGADGPIIASLARAHAGTLETPLYKGLLALTNNDLPSASRHLVPLRSTWKNPILRGAIAVTLAESASPQDARQLLLEARLFASGTLIEEAASRRLILLTAAEKRITETLELTRRYHWRFPSSPYQSTLHALLATVLVSVRGPHLELELSGMISSLGEDPPLGLDVLLAITRAALTGGRLDVAQQALAAFPPTHSFEGQKKIRHHVYRLASNPKVILTPTLRTDIQSWLTKLEAPQDRIILKQFAAFAADTAPSFAVGAQGVGAQKAALVRSIENRRLEIFGRLPAQLQAAAKIARQVEE